MLPPSFKHVPGQLTAHGEMVLLAFLMGALYCGMHLLNGWALRAVEFSNHINLVYLPGFLRLANVLILGLFWGSCATAIGGLMLLYWSLDNLFLSLCNIAVSATTALLTVWVMNLLQQRPLALSRLSDLVSLAFLYALFNALGHHLMWSWLDPSQLIRPEQLIYMVMGDINGVILGGLFLRWISRKTQLTRRLRTRRDD